MYLLKIVILHLLFSLVFMYYGGKYTFTKNYIAIKGRDSRIFTRIMGIVSLLIVVFFLKSLVSDMVGQHHYRAVVEIAHTERVSSKHDLYRRVEFVEPVSDDRFYDVWFHEFNLSEGERYEITYLENSKIITSARLLSPRD